MHKSSSQKALKVISIITVVYASFVLLGSLILLLLTGVLGAAATSGVGGAFAALLVAALGIGVLLSGAFNLIVGIFGIRAADNPEKIGPFFVLIIISVVFASIGALVNLMGSVMDFWTVLRTLFGLALPIASCALAANIKKENSLRQPSLR